MVIKEDGGCQDCDVYPGSDWSLLPDTSGLTSLVDITNLGEVDPWGPGPMYGGMFVLIIVIQAFVTMGLHCTELIVNVSRDEEVWRHMTTTRGYVAGSNTVLAAMKSWKTLVLFALKPVAHWFFGMGMTYYYGWGIFMRPPQILYLTISVVVLALFATVLCFRRPKGPQPATYGHLKTVVDLIDDYEEHMFWGHKYKNSEGVNHAGTASQKLQDIIMDESYAHGKDAHQLVRKRTRM